MAARPAPHRVAPAATVSPVRTRVLRWHNMAAGAFPSVSVTVSYS
jgi:hypothetical protein